MENFIYHFLSRVYAHKVTAILSEICGFEVTSSEVSRAIQELDVQLEACVKVAVWLPMALIWKARERF